MEVKSEKNKTVLKLSLDGGVHNGKQKLLSKSFSRVKTSAKDENIYNVGIILSDLQKRNLMEVSKVETSVLSKE